MAVTEASHAAAREVDDLYRRHGGEVYRYAFAVLGNHADAEDVTQTTFLNAYRSLEQGVRPRKPTNWLLTIASNAIKQRFRQEQSRPRYVELDHEVADASADDETPSVGELLTALSKIPPQQRQAIVLREFEGRSYTEIADILGITTSALETLLFRARRSLAEELEHHLTCTEAQLAISRATDDRLGRKDRRRLREHIAECPDCAHFARVQQRHRRALRGLALVPIPLSLAMLKSLQGSGTAAAATLPTAGGSAAMFGSSAVAAGSGGAAATTTGGGIFAGSVALKVAAVVAAAGVAVGGAAVGAKHILASHGHSSAPAQAPKQSRSTRGASALTGAGLGAKGKGKALGTIGQSPGRARSAQAPGQAHRKNRGAVSTHSRTGKSATTHGKSGQSHGKSSASQGKSSASQGESGAKSSQSPTGQTNAQTGTTNGAKTSSKGSSKSTPASDGQSASSSGQGSGNGGGNGKGGGG
jgi:RNA polymerase sigma factor (sigma-70 family)